MRAISIKLASAAAALALLSATPVAAAPTAYTATTTPNGWVTFSQLNPAGATALAGSSALASPEMIGTAAAAAQPAEGDYRPNRFPWPVAVVLLGVVAAAIYIALIEKHYGRFTVPGPNSPS